MRKEHFSFPSADGRTTLNAMRWIPDGEITAAVQIIHGMQEFIERYDELASFLCEHGFLVYGEDHLGHGASVADDRLEDLGFFTEHDAALTLVKDIAACRELTAKAYPGLRLFMLGHSFGSYLLRLYLTMPHEALAGAIIMGSGMQSMTTVNRARKMARFLQKLHGPKYRSLLMNLIAFGHNNDRIKHAKTPFEWLSHNRASIDAYIANPRNNFTFTLNGFFTIGDLVEWTQDTERLKQMPKELPVLLVSGAEDPVGDYGKSVQKIYEMFRTDAGMKDVTLKLFDDMRHEILNETDRAEVYAYLLEWIEGK